MRSSGVSAGRLSLSLATLCQRRIRLEAWTEKVKREKGPALIALENTLRRQEEIWAALQHTAFSEKALFLTGWIDVKDRPRLLSLLQKLCGDRFIIAEEKDPKAPVRLINPPF